MNIVDEVKRILFELSGEENIENTATLQDDLALDSLSMVSLLLEIEVSFGIELDESDMDPFALDTVQSIVDLVERYIGEEHE